MHEVCGAYVDNLLSAAEDVFKKQLKLTKETFKMEKYENGPCKFSGFALDYKKDCLLSQH